MVECRMKRQRESEIAMGDALEGDFRKAMRSLASAVSIVSTAHDDRRFGMTATAVCSLSMQPPTLLVCVNQSTSLHHPLLSAGRFCINILHADQDELARTFGQKGIEDRFANGNWQVDDRGVPSREPTATERTPSSSARSTGLRCARPSIRCFTKTDDIPSALPMA
jgi:flavin reductase (DIM6/NTAB) family NADH-FMN oxidoreductase RutF